ncbi:MAG: 6-carboxytetrahydropterin synthase [Gammaproteobacteria bacterium]|nr:6-carboxytetrahydropterin synthase [Gammaproteobacteria bacterium]
MQAATSRFEAARPVDMLPVGHRCRRMHGHGFTATAYSAVPADWVAYPGGEVVALQQRVDRCADLLNYGVLNEYLIQPTDENLARWIREKLNAPWVERVAVQSTPNQGVEVDARDIAHVWRRYRFQAAHQLPHVPPGHKCGRLHGHGFQAIVHANQDLAGSDLSIDYDHLDQLWAPIAAQVNYRCLNDVSGLENPTSEMISSWLWERLKPALPALSWVTVYETASCGATFDGLHYRIWKDFTIDSAVRHGRAPANDPRQAIHGHTYTLRLHLCAPLDHLMGWTIDFGDVKAVFDPIFKTLDHHPLHEHAELADGDTTTIARWLHEAARRELPHLSRVDLFESEGCGSLVGLDLAGPALPV